MERKYFTVRFPGGDPWRILAINEDDAAYQYAENCYALDDLREDTEWVVVYVGEGMGERRHVVPFPPAPPICDYYPDRWHSWEPPRVEGVVTRERCRCGVVQVTDLGHADPYAGPGLWRRYYARA